MARQRFQTFDQTLDNTHTAERLGWLREQMKIKGLDGFFVPKTDEFQNEVVPASSDRLRWLTGFTGTAGFAFVSPTACVLFVDGRYTLQASHEVDTAHVQVQNATRQSVEDWFTRYIVTGARLGYHGWLHTVSEIERLNKMIGKLKASLVALETNPIDVVWHEGRPFPPSTPVRFHPLEYAGQTADQKILTVQRKLLDHKMDAMIVTDHHNVAWLLNIRGSDIPHTPITLCHAVVMTDERPRLFIDPAKITTSAMADSLTRLADLYEPAALDATLFALGRGAAAVRIDPTTCPERLRALLAGGGAKVEATTDIITELKAIKNPTEIDGAKTAHRRDGIAMVKLLAWLDREAGRGPISEIDIVERLEDYRAEHAELIDISFPTIAGSGPNGAIVHYRPTHSSNRTLQENDLLLLDSGAQYTDGTTDVTRTVAIGTPTAEQKDLYTRVLKGHIALSRACFPQGSTGAELDPFARQYLWAIGADYDHGTGHGIGSVLSVHEGPQRIAKSGQTPLEVGMLLSNEPGLYREGAFGIRIENVILVEERAPATDITKRTLGFSTLTRVPYDINLIDLNSLTLDERQWIDAYHATVREDLVDALEGYTKTWLLSATDPLPSN